MIFRLTKNCAEQINSEMQSETLAENRYCDWTCDISIFNRKKYFVIANTFSLFSVVFPAKGIKDEKSFAAAAKDELKSYLKNKGLVEIFSSFIEKNFEEILFEKTNSRSVLGAMNSLKFELEFEFKRSGNIEERKTFFKIDDSVNDYPRRVATSGKKDYILPDKYFVSEKMKEPIAEISCEVPKTKTSVYKIYAELEDFEPKIWRRFLINPQCTMDTFAFALMAMFNMDGSHIFQFDVSVKEKRAEELKKQGMTEKEIKFRLALTSDIIVQYYIDEEMDKADDEFMLNELHQVPPKRFEAYSTRLLKFMKEDGDLMTFSYDFGDGWKIKIKLEKTDETTNLPAKKLPLVLEGEGLGIIENCGGSPGLEEIRKAFKSKKGEEYENFKEWLGTSELDLDSFNKDEVNKTIRKKMKEFNKMFYE